MKSHLAISKGFRDYRDGNCAICQEVCYPRVRFSYDCPLVKDKHGNTAINGEFETCQRCAKKKKWTVT